MKTYGHHCVLQTKFADIPKRTGGISKIVFIKRDRIKKENLKVQDEKPVESKRREEKQWNKDSKERKNRNLSSRITDSKPSHVLVY